MLQAPPFYVTRLQQRKNPVISEYFSIIVPELTPCFPIPVNIRDRDLQAPGPQEKLHEMQINRGGRDGRRTRPGPARLVWYIASRNYVLVGVGARVFTPPVCKFEFRPVAYRCIQYNPD